MARDGCGLASGGRRRHGCLGGRAKRPPADVRAGPCTASLYWGLCSAPATRPGGQAGRLHGCLMACLDGLLEPVAEVAVVDSGHARHPDPRHVGRGRELGWRESRGHKLHTGREPVGEQMRGRFSIGNRIYTDRRNTTEVGIGGTVAWGQWRANGCTHQTSVGLPSS